MAYEPGSRKLSAEPNGHGHAAIYKKRLEEKVRDPKVVVVSA